MNKLSTETKICGILIIVSIIGACIVCCMRIIIEDNNILFGLVPFIVLVVISGISYDHFLNRNMKID